MKHNSSSKEKCKCKQCQMVEEALAEGLTAEDARERYRAFEQEKLAEYGWIVHSVGDDSDSPTGFNVHTHGLVENFDHPDFQIVIQMPPQYIYAILEGLVDRVKEGERFSADEMVDDVLHGFQVKMVEATECGRTVLRIILPDKKGNCDSWTMEDPYLRQYGDLVELPELAEKFKPKKWSPFKG